jgi:hypothetical protein
VQRSKSSGIEGSPDDLIASSAPPPMTQSDIDVIGGWDI